MGPLLRCLALSVAAGLAGAPALGQNAPAGEYPSRGITLIMPLAPGSGGDVLGRVVAAKMAAGLGRHIVIENVTGASGMIGIDRVNRAEPDGYTLLGSGDNQLIYAPQFNPNAKFDPLADFAPISQLAVLDWVLVANPSLPAKTVPELVTLAKNEPGKLSFSSGGIGSAQQIAMELFMAKTGTKLNHVPYRGATPALNDVVSGVVPIMFTATSVAQPFLENGTLRALASAGAQRSPRMPDVPTLAESGLPGFEFTTWMGLLAPAKTPPEIVARLSAAAKAAVKAPDIQSQLAAGGFVPVGSAPEEFKATLARDHEKIRDVIRAAGITAK